MIPQLIKLAAMPLKKLVTHQADLDRRWQGRPELKDESKRAVHPSMNAFRPLGITVHLLPLKTGRQMPWSDAATLGISKSIKAG